MGKDLKLLSFRLVPKTRKPKTETRISNALVTGTCFFDEEDNVFKMHVVYPLPDETTAMRVCELTDDSYDLKNREVVFDKVPDPKYGRGIHIRREQVYKFWYGLTSQYVTVCEGHSFNGWLVRTADGKLKFKLNRWIGKYNEYNPTIDTD